MGHPCRRQQKVKFKKRHVYSRTHKLPEIRFEDQRLSSYGGLVVIQALFTKLNFGNRLRTCFSHIKSAAVVDFRVVSMILIVHLILGYRRLREMDHYRDDPLVLRTLGLKRMPDVATVTRRMAELDLEAISRVRTLNRELVLEPLKDFQINRVTLDFDGSVLSTGRKAEGTAVGYNTKKKGKRSYYPLFCTVAQTGQVFDVHHRPGNVHDSNGADRFIRACIDDVRAVLPKGTLESRFDSAFFSDKTVRLLDAQRVFFTITVPFERFAEVKDMIQDRKRWRRIDDRWSYFELDWSPACWDKRFRMIAIRQKVNIQQKTPIQLDLFAPHEQGYQFKLIATNKKESAKAVLQFHNGRGAQENVFGEVKDQCNMDYVPVRKLAGNQMYLMASVLSHNLFRRLQIETMDQRLKTSAKRSPLHVFEEAATIRLHIIHRAGRLTRPQGKLRLTMSGNERIRDTILEYLDALKPVA